jgi:hypothetical protein
MVHDRLGKQIIEATAIAPICGYGVDVEQRVSLCAADRVTGSVRKDKNTCTKVRVMLLDSS